MYGVEFGAGTVFAGYRIEGLLGRGGMGTVYLATHPRLPRRVALKLLNRELSADDEVRGRFEREADVSARLDHPGIVSVLDRGVEDGLMWISMQYVDGTDASVFRGSPMAPGRAVDIIAQTAEALDYAHERGVLHRDVKPANILLTATSGRDRVLLTDFGIARLRGDARQLTRTGAFLATLAYASPEQLSGASIDHRSDQYSLGCSLYTLLTGESPFPADNPGAVVAAHLTKPVPRVSDVVAASPPSLDAVIARALAKAPDERFGSCVEFAQAAARALVDVATLTAEARLGPVRSPVRESLSSTVLGPNEADRGRGGLPPTLISGARSGVSGSQHAVAQPPAGGAGRAAGLPDAEARRNRPSPPGHVPPPRDAGNGSPRAVSSRWRVLAVILLVLAMVAGIGVIGVGAVYWKFVRPHRQAPLMPWGRHHDIAIAFPQLIPADPTGTGWRAARCFGVGTVVALAGDPVPVGQVVCTQPDDVTIWYTEYNSSADVETYLAKHTQEVGRRDRAAGAGSLLVFRPTDPAAPFTLATHSPTGPTGADILVEVAWPEHGFDELRTGWWEQAPF
ncbi:protein kinase [Nocardia halotolerans]|uniref:non-specific serine/threonine protein kinase n=1 Tax=Nocardia halotolerans TaxID=1755878 RepID=A0ABV8VI48_9NOCA